MDLNIQMVDLKSQYFRLKNEIDTAISSTIEKSQFIKGRNFKEFQLELAAFLGVENVIACGNGTDALQIAIMALDLNKGDEVIVPSFTYVATAEVIGLLGLKPVIIDVDAQSFNITADLVSEAINSKTKLIVPVHLFGQCTDMEPIINIAKEKNIKILEDTAQSLGAKYTFKNGTIVNAGCMGEIGTTSFFPSKNLGCMGDGGAMFTNNVELKIKMEMIASHGQKTQYVHEVIGVNSRLDELQAAILRVKLPQLLDFEKRRNAVANYYDRSLSKIKHLEIPFRQPNSSHVFHQYTIKVKNGLRNDLKTYLLAHKIPSMIYYPKPLHHQNAFKEISKTIGSLKVTEMLCDSVLSLPIHTEMTDEQLGFISNTIETFFNGK